MRKLNLKSTGLRAVRGSVTIESVVGLPAFFLIVFLGIETLRFSFVALSLQFGVVNTARWAALNLTDGPGTTRVESIENKVRRFSNLEINGDHIAVCPAPLQPGCNENTDVDSGPGTWIAIKANYPIELLFGAVQYTLNATAMVKNEPDV